MRGASSPRFLLAALAVSAALLAAACGPAEPSPSVAGPTATSDDPGPAATNDIAGLPADDIVAESINAFRAASSFRARMAGTVGNVQTDVDNTVSERAAFGRMVIAGATIRYLRIDDIYYLTADRATLQGSGGGSVEQLEGSWFKGPKGSAVMNEESAELLSPEAWKVLVGGFENSVGWSVRRTTADTVELVLDALPGTEMTVARIGAPYPLRMHLVKEPQVLDLEFGEYDRPVTVTAPSDALDAGALPTPLG